MASRTLDLPQDWAYAVVTAVRHHGRWIPLTRVDAPARALRAGDDVVGRSALVLVDRMRVTHADAPRELRLVKTGPLLLGEVTITVRPDGPSRAVVDWVEEGVHLRGPLPRRLTAALLRPSLEAMTALALWRIHRSVRRERRRRSG
ncbi:SRPBCC family protein [Georgenia satyanarayanai]|uniref:SRPBCC family protein n=1 Tax=Georgenia satyanarayanai TaxID=860221 RepID=UPI00126408A9|nr:SRPBCC family protein [Georgenia satyanarayanai]